MIVALLQFREEAVVGPSLIHRSRKQAVDSVIVRQRGGNAMTFRAGLQQSDVIMMEEVLCERPDYAHNRKNSKASLWHDAKTDLFRVEHK